MLKTPWSSFAVVLVEKRQYPQGSGSILIAYITTYFRIVLFHVQNALVIVSGCSWDVSNCFRYNVNFTLRGRDRFLFIEYFYSRSRSISSLCIPFTFNTNIQSKFEALILFRVTAQCFFLARPAPQRPAELNWLQNSHRFQRGLHSPRPSLAVRVCT